MSPLLGLWAFSWFVTISQGFVIFSVEKSFNKMYLLLGIILSFLIGEG